MAYFLNIALDTWHLRAGSKYWMSVYYLSVERVNAVTSWDEHRTGECLLYIYFQCLSSNTLRKFPLVQAPILLNITDLSWNSSLKSRGKTYGDIWLFHLILNFPNSGVFWCQCEEISQDISIISFTLIKLMIIAPHNAIFLTFCYISCGFDVQFQVYVIPYQAKYLRSQG